MSNVAELAALFESDVIGHGRGERWHPPVGVGRQIGVIRVPVALRDDVPHQRPADAILLSVQQVEARRDRIHEHRLAA